MMMETPNQSAAEEESAEVQNEREVMQEAVRLMERLNDMTFTFIDPVSGILVHEGSVIDLKKEHGDWTVTVQDGDGARQVVIDLGHLRNIQLEVKS